MSRIKLTKRTIDALASDLERYTVWDKEISGFGVRVTPTGPKVYILKYRAASRQRWYTIGRHGSPWTPENARKKARELLGEIAKGLDPADTRDSNRDAMTISELCDLYIAEGSTHKKSSTLKVDLGRIRHHLKPFLGTKRVDSVTRADAERLLVAVSAGRTATAHPKTGGRPAGSLPRGGSGVAAQCVTLLAILLEFAKRRGLRDDNPARGIKKPPVHRLERFLSAPEMARLAVALEAETKITQNPFAAAAIKLLLLTGCRRSEILGLQWQHVDFDRRCLRLPDSKTGAKVVFLNAPALEILKTLPHVEQNPYVIAGARKDGPLIGIDKIWFRIRKNAGLQNVRLHDLRHSFASVGAVGGISLPIIGALLGHKHTTTTARYAHLSADPLRAANEAVGAQIAAAMMPNEKAKATSQVTANPK